MKSIGQNFLRAIVALAALLEFSVAARAESLSDIFTNVAPAARPAIPRRASIIFIQVDGLGCGDLSCYGQTNFQTPNLDKLAAGGILFTNYSVADAAPSHAALLLGKNFSRARADVSLAANDVTVAQILKLSGYHTGLIGNWDLGAENSAGAPWKKGFDEFAGYFGADATNFYADYIFRYAPRTILDPQDKAAHFVGREMLYYNTGGKHGTYIPDLYETAAENFAKENQPDAFNHWRPFFLLLNYTIPDGKISVPSDAPFSEEPWPQPEKNRAALISRIDDSIGQLRAKLDKLAMTNNVLIFFAGASVPKKSAATDPAFFHENFSTNDFRAPLIANWPGQIPAGGVSGLKLTAADFLPTAAQVGYAKTPKDIDGASILDELIGVKRQ